MSIELHTVRTAPCPLCSATLYLTVKVPCQPEGSPGLYKVITLCPKCSSDDEAAHGLLSFFAFHATIGQESAAEFSTLLEEWISVVQVRVPDERAIAREAEQWRSGAL